jgi:hypothetical protein
MIDNKSLWRALLRDPTLWKWLGLVVVDALMLLALAALIGYLIGDTP